MLSKLYLLFVFGFAAEASAEQLCQFENIPATTPSGRFVVNSEGTVSDAKTTLMWRSCVEGVSGARCDEGQALQLNWAEALIYVSQLNAEGGYATYTDWRLPNVRELSSLVELQCANPAINIRVFPQAPASQVWTSSPYHFYTHYSWYVDFANGAPTYDERIRDKMIRLVRDVSITNR